MTERLYYNDPTCLEFEATVIESVEQSDSSWHTLLDRSAFYPTSGGQSHDTGLLNQTVVTDVIESDTGEVVHVTAAKIAEPGQTVKGLVDEERRFRHRQQHTAQHLLSQAFFRLCEAVTVSVHLGDEYGAIEFDKSTITPEIIGEAEKLANEVIGANLPIEIIFADPSQIDKLGLRRPPKREGKLRIIKIGDFECTACGGTHCLSTAEVRLVKITGTESIRKRTRIRFLAGTQALRDYQERFDSTSQLTRSLTCHVTDLPDKFARLSEDLSDAKTKLTALRKELLPAEINKLIGLAEDVGKTKLVVAEVEPDLLAFGPQLTLETAEKIEGVALIIFGERVFLGVSESSELNAGALLRSLSEESDIKGGGSATLAQGGGARPNLIEQYRSILKGLLC